MPYPNSSVLGLDMAAGAMSKAIGDIFRGRTEATEAFPAQLQNAEALEGARQGRAISMAKLPYELADAHTRVRLGEHKLRMAPLEFDTAEQGRDTGALQLGELKRTVTDRATARQNAVTQAQRMIDDPKTPNDIRVMLQTNLGNADALLSITGKMAERTLDVPKDEFGWVQKYGDPKDVVEFIQKTKFAPHELKEAMVTIQLQNAETRRVMVEGQLKNFESLHGMRAENLEQRERFNALKMEHEQAKLDAILLRAEQARGKGDNVVAQDYVRQALDSISRDEQQIRTEMQVSGNATHTADLQRRLAMIEARKKRVLSLHPGAPVVPRFNFEDALNRILGPVKGTK